MPTRNISLTREQDEFVDSVVRAGEYQDASEAIRDAVRALQQRRREDALKLEALRALIGAGANALEEADFAEVENDDLDRFVATLTSIPRARAG